MGTVSPGIKIIGAGMPRTGTMSLKIALEQLGYAQCYHMVDLMQNLSHVPDWLAVSRGETIDWDTMLTGYQAIVDIPGQRYYQELMQAYPDAKVILSTRDPARWYDSVQQTIYQTHQLNEVETTWWWLRYPLSERRKNKALLGGLIGKILWDDYFAQRFEDKGYVLSVYENHLKAVRAHVPAEQLLEFDVAEGWQPLCDFLDAPVPPKEAFPHVNDREQFREFWEIKEAKSQIAITTLAQQVEKHSVKSPGATSLIYQNNAISYRELQARSQQVAHLLHQHGVTTGSPIAILLPNCPEFVISYLAIQQLSGVSITINTALTHAEISHILDDSQAELLITITQLQQSIAQENHPRLTKVLLTDTATSHPDSLLRQVETKSTPSIQAATPSADDPAVILYSSGTTGRPKGAVLSHGNLLSSAYRIADHLDLTTDDRILLCLPLFHCYALTTILNPALHQNVSLVILPEFEANEWIQAITKYQITTVFAVPTIYTLLIQQDIPDEALASVRHCLAAGAPLPTKIAKRWQDKFGVPITNGLGFTEGAQVTLNPDPANNPESIGLPLPGVEVKVIDETGQPCQPDIPGEIVVRGTNIMLGYLNQPDRGFSDGWFHSGDIGRQDKAGHLYVIDRRKDMVNVGGEKVYPTEVEQVLYGHPKVAEAAVYGVPHPVMGEEVRASILLKPRQTANETEIIDFCREQLAHFKLPSVVEFPESLPKGKTGKILKRVLRERFSTATASQNTTQLSLRQQLLQKSSAEARSAVLKPYLQTEVRQLTGHKPEYQQSVFELGVDSLMSIQLANRLAIDLGLALPSTLIMEYPSIQQLAEQLADELTLHATNASKPNHLKHADTEGVIPTNTMTTDAAVAWDIYDWFPQSYIQQLYYGWHEAAENKSFMNMNFVVRIRSVINSEHLQTATQMLLDRHADLRLVYDRQNGQPVQKARRHQPAFFVAQTIDCATWEEARPALLQASRQPFDLRHDSTMRVYLFSRTPDDHILLIVRHHIINDRTSAAIVLDELFTLYHAQATDTLVPAPAAPSYFEFLHWHNTMLASEQGQQLWQYWQQQLSGPLSVLDLPTDYPRHAKNRHHGGLVNFQLPATLVNSLRQLAKTHGVTLYAAMLTAFKLLLHFHTGQRDILVDTSMINRTHQQFEQTAGQLSIMHTLRTQIPAAVSFPLLLKTVQQTVWDALKHQSYPSQLLLERLAMPKSYVYNRPGQVLFNLVSSNLTQASLPSLGRGKLVLEPTRIIPSGSAGTFHEINTQLLEQEDGTITGHINYETDLYKLSTIEGLMRRYEVILQRLVADPQQTITDLQNHYATSQDKEVA